MTEAEIVNILKESGALLNGHFQLRSGLHSDHFFQAALLLQYPDKAEIVCRLADVHIRAGEQICRMPHPQIQPEKAI